MKKIFTQMIKFYLIGISGIFVNLGILYLLTDFLKIWYMFSAFAGIAVSITTNFLGNKYWTFRDKTKNIKGIANQYVKYWISSSISIIIQLSFIYFFVQYLKIWYLFASIIAIAIASFSNFLLSKYWAFKTKI